MLKIFRQTSFLAAVGILLVIFIPGYAKIQELRQKNQELEANVRKMTRSIWSRWAGKN
jgi:uncharacterized membrane protein